LGRGLKALLEGTDVATSDAELLQLSVTQVRSNPYQPRQHFDSQRLQELADSIKAQGIVQPIVVRRCEDGFELIAGERRLRASQLAGCDTIPALVKKASDREMLELALLENLQREDLNPLEEARAYQRLLQEFHLRQEDVAQCVGKDRSSIANALRLLKLPQEFQDDIEAERLTMGHARALLALDTVEAQRHLRDQILAEGLSVRDTETRARAQKTPIAQTPDKLPHVLAAEQALRQRLGTLVAIKPGLRSGKIEIAYSGEEELQRLLGLLRVQDEGILSPTSTKGVL
jgi:ParB family chromosome partitioning protein